MDVPPFKKYRPCLTHAGSLLASGMAAAMDSMSPATPASAMFVDFPATHPNLPLHPWARFQAVLANGSAPPLMQMASTRELPRLFAVWQSHGEDLVATEMSLMTNASTSPGCSHAPAAALLRGSSVTTVLAGATATGGREMSHILPVLLVAPVPSVVPSVDNQGISAPCLQPDAAMTITARPSLCPSLASLPEYVTLPGQDDSPHFPDVDLKPAGFAMSKSATSSSGTIASRLDDTSGVCLAPKGSLPHDVPMISSSCRFQHLPVSLGLAPAGPPCYRTAVINMELLASCTYVVYICILSPHDNC